MEKAPHAGAVITFRHDVGMCGCFFQTTVGVLKDYPEKVSCPGCIGKNTDHHKDLLKELGEVAARFYDIKSQLSRDHNLLIVGGLGVEITISTTPR